VIKLRFPRLSCFDRSLEPATVAVPFPQGALVDIGRCRIADAAGKTFPGQFRVTTRWPDGSVKWLLVHLQADLPANKGADYFLDTNAADPAFASSMCVSASCVDTGALKIALSNTPDALFDSITTPQGTFTREEISPFTITDGKGNAYTAGAGEKGWEVIESGPVRAMLRTRGRHTGASGTWFDYIVTLYAYAGKSWIDLDYRVINTESGKPLELANAAPGLTVSSIASMNLRLTPKACGETACFVAHSNYVTTYQEGETEKLIDDQYLLFTANEQNPEVLYGTLYADWQDEKRAVCATIYQAQQNFPKRVAVSKDALTVDLIPESTGAVEFIEGMSKTHRMQLYFHAPNAARREDINFRSLQYQLPDKPTLEPAVYEATGIYEDIFTAKRNGHMEFYLEQLFADRSKAYGILHWGDNPDSGYTLQGRGMGDIVWINGEYDAGHSFYLYYITHYRRAAFAAMKVATEHLIDVDICHHSADPGRMGGQVVHSARHVTRGCTPSHEWVESLLDYYHETGDPDVLEMALAMGRNIQYLLENKIFKFVHGGFGSARESGWALFAMSALYKETFDEYWLKHCETIVSLFVKWEQQMGAFISPYTDHSMIRVPFMISVAINALKSLYNARPSEEIRGLILRAVQDLVENCIDEFTGLFYYKQLPSLDVNVLSVQVFGPLTYAYQFTGDKKYLEYALPTFREMMQKVPKGGGGKSASYHCVISGTASSSNKAFSSGAPHLMVYYKALMDTGLLEA